MQRKPETAYNIEKWPFGSCNNICFKMTPNGDGAILRRNMWFPLSLKSIRGSIGQHNPKVYMRGFFYCPVQQRRVKAYVTGGIFFLYLWLWGQVVNTDNRPKYWHTKGVGRLNHVQKSFPKGVQARSIFEGGIWHHPVMNVKSYNLCFTRYSIKHYA